jgi:hypothetical protein
LAIEPDPAGHSKNPALSNDKSQISQDSNSIFKKQILLTQPLSNPALSNPYPIIFRHLFNILYCIIIILKKLKKMRKKNKIPKYQNKKYNLIFLYKYKLTLKKYNHKKYQSFICP